MKIRIAVTLVVLGLLHLGPGKGPGSSFTHFQLMKPSKNEKKGNGQGTLIWALASALAPSGKESPRKNENPVFDLIKKDYS